MPYIIVSFIECTSAHALAHPCPGSGSRANLLPCFSLPAPGLCCAPPLHVLCSRMPPHPSPVRSHAADAVSICHIHRKVIAAEPSQLWFQRDFWSRTHFWFLQQILLKTPAVPKESSELEGTLTGHHIQLPCKVVTNRRREKQSYINANNL